MVDLSKFIEKWDDTSIDWDGGYGSQCVDLAKLWEAENGWPVISGNALNIIDNADKNFYDVVNSPQAGDIVVWGSGVGELGHIAVFVSQLSADTFNSFDQNWPIGSPCHIQQHTYKNIIGYLRPKGETMPEPCFASRAMVVGKIKELLDYWYYKLYSDIGIPATLHDTQIEAEQIADSNIDLVGFLKEQVRTDFFKYFVRRTELEELNQELNELKLSQAKEYVCPPCPDINELSASELLAKAIRKFLGIK